MNANKLNGDWLIYYDGIPGTDFVVSEENLFNIYNIGDN